MRNMASERKKRRLTQIDLANLTAIKQSQISVIETGKVKPNARTRAAIENVLGPIDWTETTILPLRSGTYYEAERLVNKLVSITVALSEKDKASIKKLINKYFNN
jgi:transcriptional regulator with XRE-family HTH domain